MVLGNKQILSSNIIKYLNKKDISRIKMSNDLNISYSTLRDWIKGNTYPRIDKIKLMANYFGVNKSDLIEDKTKLSNNVVPISGEIKRIPVIDTIACRTPSRTKY